jgi:hypothetical protein
LCAAFAYRGGLITNPCDRTQKAEGCVASIFFAIYSVNFREIDKNFISFV